MNKKILFVLLPAILACNFLFPAQATPSEQQVVSTVAPSTLAPSPTAPEKNQNPAPTETVKVEGFIVVRLHPEDGDLQAMLKTEAQKAIAQGLMPVAEFDATWCPPCKAIETALEEKNELMVKAYEGTYIIKMDVDEWVWDDGRVQNFAFDGIPVYFKLDENGEQTGDVIDGGAWGDNIPENMAPLMDKFFHGE
ncbi:MAG: thioredoxin family protein [Anaerolineales bacterium]